MAAQGHGEHPAAASVGKRSGYKSTRTKLAQMSLLVPPAESRSSLAGLGARCVSFLPEIYLSLALERRLEKFRTKEARAARRAARLARRAPSKCLPLCSTCRPVCHSQ
eukprot:scaffold66288_cov69-Phaeocystis_antarctica.AAC.2